jgi:hypothetical protein
MKKFLFLAFLLIAATTNSEAQPQVVSRYQHLTNGSSGAVNIAQLTDGSFRIIYGDNLLPIEGLHIATLDASLNSLTDITPMPTSHLASLPQIVANSTNGYMIANVMGPEQENVGAWLGCLNADNDLVWQFSEAMDTLPAYPNVNRPIQLFIDSAGNYVMPVRRISPVKGIGVSLVVVSPSGNLVRSSARIQPKVVLPNTTTFEMFPVSCTVYPNGDAQFMG